MRLLTKTQRYYFGLFSVLLVLWSVIFFVVINLVLKGSIDETITSEMKATMERLSSKELLENHVQANSLFEAKEITEMTNPTFVYSDTVIFDPFEGEDVPYRKVTSELLVDGTAFKISMLKSMVEYEDLFTAIFLTELAMVILLLGGMFWLNKGMLEKIWQPFFSTLQKISEYRVSRDASIRFEATDIQEFSDLNQVLITMTDQIRKDYENLKQFTENASHEIQTPLAVIQSRIELMLQNDQNEINDLESIQEIYHAAGHLSRLNKALLLLTKIENDQFQKDEVLNVNSLIEELLPEYEELASQKHVSVQLLPSEECVVRGNRMLMVSMFRNLISNSIRHNIELGEITITIKEQGFSIANSGQKVSGDPNQFFNRFTKNSSNPNSLGLGLSIVKKIADLHGFECIYTVQENIHRFDINFAGVEHAPS